jgi:hypothetical protein
MALTPMRAREAIAIGATTVVDPARPVETVEAKVPRSPGRPGRGGKALELAPREAHADLPLEDSDQGRDHARVAHGLLHRGPSARQRSGKAWVTKVVSRATTGRGSAGRVRGYNGAAGQPLPGESPRWRARHRALGWVRKHRLDPRT